MLNGAIYAHYGIELEINPHVKVSNHFKRQL